VRPSIVLLLLPVVSSWTAGCGDEFRSFDAAVAYDAGVPDIGVEPEGGVPVGAVFTIAGCTTLSFDSLARPICTSPPERPLTFIPLGVNVASVLWTLPGASPATSKALTPEATWSQLGSYDVMLAAEGGGGAALGTGTVDIVGGAAGSTCASDADCDGTTGLRCLCGAGQDCPGALAAGLCARRCEDTPCDADEACVDLTRGGSAPPDGGVDDGGVSEAFRVRVCLPPCTSTSSCRVGFTCRSLPVVAIGAPADGAYTWSQACFADVLGDVGAPCRDPSGALDDASCLTGHCQALGARGICTDACSASAACPSYATCATLPSDGSLCLADCAKASDCADPLIDCIGPGAGGLGYTLPASAPSTTTLCAPKRCSQPSDCAPAGTCTSVGGAEFCVES
jgi:hypothetical protein